MMRLGEVVGGDGHAWDALCAARQLRGALEDRIVELVARGRRAGWSWALCGQALGVTAQAVCKRYAALIEEDGAVGHRGGRSRGPQVR